MDKLLCGISCNLDSNILATALPLFEAGIVEAIEWSFDALFRHTHIPVWFEELLRVYAEAILTNLTILQSISVT